MSGQCCLAFELHGNCLVPDGTLPLEGVRNQFVLPSRQIISTQAVVEIASGPAADDRHDLGFTEAEALGIMIELSERMVEFALLDEGH